MVQLGDYALDDQAEDLLGRRPMAEQFARYLLELDSSDGLVTGVVGPWGSGKTTFVNFSRVELDRLGVVCIDFNPWMFSGADQLVDRFFGELVAQLRMHADLADVAEAIESYSSLFAGLAWLPLVGTWIERGRRLSKLFTDTMKKREEGVDRLRERVTEKLAQRERPIVIVIDDIDRLTNSEVREIFKLVRLTASFPNIVYITVFDRHRVEQALSEAGVPGRAFLEKIVQYAADLPTVPEHVLRSQTASALDSAIAASGRDMPFSEEVWPDIYFGVVAPMVKTMRDVRRLAMAVRGTLGTLDARVELADVIALESVRVFMPDVFSGIVSSAAALTTADAGWFPHAAAAHDAAYKAQVERLLDLGKEHRGVVEQVIERVFPAAQRHLGGTRYPADWNKRWLLERRVAAVEVLNLYLERIVGERIEAVEIAEVAFAAIGDSDEFEQALRRGGPERYAEVVDALEVLADQFEAQHAATAVPALLNLYPDIPDGRPGGMFDISPRLAVGRINYLFLDRLQDAALVEDLVRTVLPQIRTLSGRFELISQVGSRKNVGHRMVTDEVAAGLEREWRDQVRAATVETLVAEPDLVLVLYWTKHGGDASEPPLEIPDANDLTIAILKDGVTDVRSNRMGSVRVAYSKRLMWTTLAKVFGSEDVLIERVRSVTDDIGAQEPELQELVLRYADGWRDEDFDG